VNYTKDQALLRALSIEIFSCDNCVFQQVNLPTYLTGNVEFVEWNPKSSTQEILRKLKDYKRPAQFGECRNNGNSMNNISFNRWAGRYTTWDNTSCFFKICQGSTYFHDHISK
jgi:hypothetical protein